MTRTDKDSGDCFEHLNDTIRSLDLLKAEIDAEICASRNDLVANIREVEASILQRDSIQEIKAKPRYEVKPASNPHRKNRSAER